MAWTIDSKLFAFTLFRILTPDSNQILVGSSENSRLIYQNQESIYTKTAKPTASWTKVEKPS